MGSLFTRCFIVRNTRVESIVSCGIDFIPKFTWVFVAYCLSSSRITTRCRWRVWGRRARCTSTQSFYCLHSIGRTPNSFDSLECWLGHISSTLMTRCQKSFLRYGGIVFATSEALLDRASYLLNCIAAAVLTQEFESLVVGQLPQRSPFTKRSYRKNASLALGLRNLVDPSCS